ncbi:MAG TPA: serine/threonine-protein kinase, partial [Chroococcales cyanobacterium]
MSDFRETERGKARITDSSDAETFLIDEIGESERLLPPGTLILDQYRVIECIGSGGMGYVYKCEEITVGRVVAVKMLQINASADSLRRFQTEGKAIAKLEHPNTVKLFSFQITPERVPILVLEYVSGISLSELLSRDGALGLQRALKLAGQICDALSAAHRVGVIHRDLKPSNIM